MGHGAIDQGIAPAALLVGRAAAVADAGDDEAVLDAAHPMLVAREPGDRADCPRGEQKTVAVARPQRGEALGQKRQQREPRAVVVGERRVADVRREQELLVRRAAVQILAVGEAAGVEARVNHHLVQAVGQRREPVVGHAEAPGLGVVGGPIGNQIGLVGQREDMLLQLVQRQRRTHRPTVVQDVQVAAAEVDHPLARGILDVRVADGPLRRDRPIEDLGAGRHLVHLEIDVPAEMGEGPAHSIAGDAAADRVDLCRQSEDRLSDAGLIQAFPQGCGRRHVRLHGEIRPGHATTASATAFRGAGRGRRRRSASRTPSRMSALIWLIRW